MKGDTKKMQLYHYVGSKNILANVSEERRGQKIRNFEDIKHWVEKTKQKIINHTLVMTFIINQDMDLVISDRHSEHVVCAGGEPVLTAGEMTFYFEEKTIEVTEISNQSTGYCPKPSSWEVIKIALNRLNIAHPEELTQAFDFRKCDNCQSNNLIKEQVFECAVCGASLSLEWNFD